MQKHYASKSGLFLIELIISIFFFIAASAVVLQLFVKSHFIGESTISINHALIYTQNIAEIFLAEDNGFDNVKAVYSDISVNASDTPSNTMLLLFDKNWEPVNDSSNARYSVFASHSTDEAFSYVNIYINEYSNNIFDFIENGDYSSALLCTGYIHHQEIKKYCSYS